ncbi:hypothetical protein Pse7429DRAFT_0108 [Pseudanabaena biceps PCC 7429]|uniref:Uncharacterized protein n=1 Tax=Pseudanabaena biceps PCC 7429 TaxID=927668 RepID=L8N581_9CYAN|nr:hypothetical protein Pse7429DRAFT_0108 [Pseudanabaena biceps PCC 7429]
MRNVLTKKYRDDNTFLSFFSQLVSHRLTMTFSEFAALIEVVSS